MTENQDRPDRFGCGAIAMTLFAGLVIILLIVGGIILFGDPSGPSRNPPDDPVGPGDGGNEIPPISDRFFDGGGSQATSSGFFNITLDLPIDDVRSYVDEDLAWIGFGELQRDASGEILIALGEPENSVTLAQGDFLVIGTDEDCAIEVEVTETTVSGHISCVGVEGQNVEDGSTGPVDFELDFTADS